MGPVSKAWMRLNPEMPQPYTPALHARNHVVGIALTGSEFNPRGLCKYIAVIQTSLSQSRRVGSDPGHPSQGMRRIDTHQDRGCMPPQLWIPVNTLPREPAPSGHSVRLAANSRWVRKGPQAITTVHGMPVSKHMPIPSRESHWFIVGQPIS